MNDGEIFQPMEIPEPVDELEVQSEVEKDNYELEQENTEESVTPDLSNLSPDLLSAFRIVDSLINASNRSVNVPFLNPVEENGKSHRNYYQVIKKPMWLMKIHADILALNYNSIQEVVADLRIVFENCYRYYGQNHPYIKKGLKLETILEQKLALLPSNLREQTTLEATSPRLAMTFEMLKEQSQQQGASQPGLTGARASSTIFQCVREEKAQKDRERKRELLELRRQEREASHQETLQWEEALLADHASDIRKMWELPQIGHFLFLAQKTLNLPEISHYELERSVFMPAGSSLMATVMTSLLSSPHQRAKLDQWPAMLYKTWENRLRTRMQHWYKVYTSKERNLLKVFELIGIEPEFFRIMGDLNPMENKTFQEITLKQRVWVLKSLCDYCLHNHKTVQDSIMEVNFEDQNKSLLGEDREGNLYVHFPQFCGQTLRIYRMTKDMDVPELDLTPPLPIVQSEPGVKTNSVDEGAKDATDKAEEKMVNGVGENSSRHNHKRKRRGRQRKLKKLDEKPAKAEPPAFELVVESVESLRNLMDCFVEAEPRSTRKQGTRGRPSKESAGQPYCEKLLHRRLKNLLAELEPWEQKLEQAVIKTRLKLKKEWEERKVKDATQDEEQDNFWGIETEEEVPQVNLESSSSSGSDYEDDPNASEFRQTHRRTCTRRKRVFESESSSSDNENEPFKITVSSRGRVCKMRNFNFVPVAEKAPPTPTPVLSTVKKVVKNTAKPVAVTLNGIEPKQRDMLESHRIQNSASDAQIQYQWETMRLKLLKENEVEKSSPKVQAEEKPKEIKKSVTVPTCAPSQNENVLDTDAFLKVGPEFGSWKSATPGSAFTEQTFSTLLDRSSSYLSLPPVKSRPPPPPKVEIVKLSVPFASSSYRPSASQVRNYAERPKLGIFREKNTAGSDKRCVKTTFAAPGILRTTISKRPTEPDTKKQSPQSSPAKPATSTTTASTTKGTLIPSLAKPGQKILVLPIKDASGNKVLLQVVPKGTQPLKLAQFKGITNAVNMKMKMREARAQTASNVNSQPSLVQSTIPLVCNQNQGSFPVHRRETPNSVPFPVQRRENPNQVSFPVQGRANQNHEVVNNLCEGLLSNKCEDVLENTSHETVCDQNEQFIQPNHPLVPSQDSLYQAAVESQIIQPSVSQDMTNCAVLQNSTLSQGQPFLNAASSEEMTDSSILHGSVSQQLTSGQILTNSVSQEVMANQMLQTPISQGLTTNQILQSPPHEHFSPNSNLSPTSSHLLATPANHSQLMHTLQSTNTAQILASTLSTQNQVLQASPNQILASVSPVLTNPDGSVTLLTQGSSGAVVLPVQTHIYAPQLYTSTEPKVIVCANGQVIDGSVGQENLFVVTAGGQLVTMDNCTFQRTMLTEQLSPL